MNAPTKDYGRLFSYRGSFGAAAQVTAELVDAFATRIPGAHEAGRPADERVELPAALAESFQSLIGGLYEHCVRPHGRDNLDSWNAREVVRIQSAESMRATFIERSNFTNQQVSLFDSR